MKQETKQSYKVYSVETFHPGEFNLSFIVIATGESHARRLAQNQLHDMDLHSWQIFNVQMLSDSNCLLVQDSFFSARI